MTEKKKGRERGKNERKYFVETAREEHGKLCDLSYIIMS